MIREITAVEACRSFDELLNEVSGKDSILIKRAGKPIAALIDIDLFEKIKDQLDRTCTSVSTEDVENEAEEVLGDMEGVCEEDTEDAIKEHCKANGLMFLEFKEE